MPIQQCNDEIHGIAFSRVTFCDVLLNASCSVMATTMFTAELVRISDAGNPFVAEWRSLMDRVNPDQQLFGPQWFTAWSNTWGQTGRWTGQLDAIAVRDDSKSLQGVLCIGNLKLGPVPVRSCGGHSVPWRPLVAAETCEEEVGRAIGRFIATCGWPVLQLGPLLRSDQTALSMTETLRERRVFMHRRDSRLQATLHAPETFDQYKTEVIGGKAFRKIGYYERRMEKSGRVEIKHVRQPTPDETYALFEALNQIESESWMATRDDAVPRFTNENLREFWTQLTLQHLSPNDYLDAWVMSLDDQPVSFCFTLTSGSVRFVIANNYSESVKDHRTGSTLYKYMLQDGIERGIRQFEFGDGNINYKSLWGAEYGDSCDTYAVIPNRVLGAIAKSTSQLKALVRRPHREDDLSDEEKRDTESKRESVGATD